ncbi:MAG: ATP-binding protein [Gammaproteobacteria bacterium]
MSLAEPVLRVPAEASRLHALRALVQASARAAGFDEAAVADLVLAVNEACMNVIQHGRFEGHGQLELAAEVLAEGIEFRLRDTAAPVTLADWRPRPLDELRPGGLGVHFIRALMDEIDYLPTPDGRGNLLRLRKYRRGARS